MGSGVSLYMSRSSGQPEASPPVFGSQANLGIFSFTHLKDERLSQPCPAPGSNPGPVTWQRNALTIAPPGINSNKKSKVGKLKFQFIEHSIGIVRLTLISTMTGNAQESSPHFYNKQQAWSRMCWRSATMKTYENDDPWRPETMRNI